MKRAWLILCLTLVASCYNHQPQNNYVFVEYDDAGNQKQCFRLDDVKVTFIDGEASWIDKTSGNIIRLRRGLWRGAIIDKDWSLAEKELHIKLSDCAN